MIQKTPSGVFQILEDYPSDYSTGTASALVASSCPAPA